MSQIEGMLPLLAGKIIEYSAFGSVGARLGNRHPVHVPHGCFRCAGADEWVVLTARDAVEWRALCETIGRADLGGDPLLMTAEGRRAREDEIEAAITAWTSLHSARDAMLALQARGVPAGAAMTATGLLADPHLLAREFWQVRDRAFVGRCTMLSAPFREGEAPYPIRRPAPTLGQDNAEVFGRLLGWGTAEIANMEARHVIGTEALAAFPKPRTEAAA